MIDKRIRVAKTWNVEYGSTEGFNYKKEEFKDILNALGVSVMGEEGADFFECDTKEFDKAVKLLKEQKERIYEFEKADNELGYTFFEDIYDAIMNLNTTAENTFDDNYNEALRLMEAYQKERAEGDAYMHFLSF